MPKSSPVTTLNQNANAWSFYSAVNTLPPTQLTPTSWGFTFPTDPGKAGYLLHNHTASITQQKLKIVGEVICSTPAPTFDFKTEASNTGTTPANFRFLLWRKGRSTSNEFDRWWSNADCVYLAPGVFSLEAPLTPDKWSSALGKMGNLDGASLAGFNAAKQYIGDIGITFGGGSFFGHGVRLVPNTGTANFVCTEFTLL